MFPFLRGAGGKLRETLQNLFQTPFRGNPDGVFIARQESSTIAWNTSAFCTRRRWHPSRRTSRSTLIVVTVTTRTEKKKNQPTHVLVDSNPAFEEPSMILLEQIFTIDKSRIERFMGYATKTEMLRIDMALLVSLALNVLTGSRSE